MIMEKMIMETMIMETMIMDNGNDDNNENDDDKITETDSIDLSWMNDLQLYKKSCFRSFL